MQEALAFHASKQRAYEILIIRLQKLAIGIARADAAKREAKGFVAQGKRAAFEWVECPGSPEARHHFSDGIALELLPSPPMLQSIHGQLLSFWRCTR